MDTQGIMHNKMSHEVEILENKLSFVMEVLSGDIEVNANIYDVLQKKRFNRIDEIMKIDMIN